MLRTIAYKADTPQKSTPSPASSRMPSFLAPSADVTVSERISKTRTPTSAERQGRIEQALMRTQSPEPMSDLTKPAFRPQRRPRSPLTPTPIRPRSPPPPFNLHAKYPSELHSPSALKIDNASNSITISSPSLLSEESDRPHTLFPLVLLSPEEETTYFESLYDDLDSAFKAWEMMTPWQIGTARNAKCSPKPSLNVKSFNDPNRSVTRRWRILAWLDWSNELCEFRSDRVLDPNQGSIS
jgi:hypothetical protein